MFKDRILKALSPHKEVLIVAVNATETLNESMTRIKAYPPSMIHLGRAMLGAALLQGLSDSDEPEIVSLQWTAEGPFGGLFAEARGLGQLRGTIDYPQAPMEDLSTKLGPGILQVRRSNPSHGVNLGSSGHTVSQGEESADIVDYLEQSEQKQCGLQLFVKIAYDDKKDSTFPFYIERAVGYLIHVLPASAQNEFTSTLASWDEIMKQLGPLSQWAWDANTDPALQILQFLLARPQPDIRTDSQINFHCTCSEDRAERALALASRMDPTDNDPLSKTNKAVLKCEFCGRVYEIPLSGVPNS